MENQVIGEGHKAPTFCLKDGDEVERCLEDYRGSWLVLYFYPKDNTPGCTLEALDFTARREDFRAEGAAIVGVSKDSCESHRRFSANKSLKITLLSDPAGTVLKKYGVERLKKARGRQSIGTVRTACLIDPAGTVVRIWDGVKAKGHADDVLRQLRRSK
ncbi:MAG: peroxiredoxin [Terriglobia bacterium]